MRDFAKLTAPCGLDCFNCQIFHENITEEIIEKLSKKLQVHPEKLSCKGCREQGGCSFLPITCSTLKCSQNMKVQFCNQCHKFPCEKFHPVADLSNKYPHNIKLYNLCRISKIGIDKWAEEAHKIRKTYYYGSFVIGNTPLLKK